MHGEAQMIQRTMFPVLQDQARRYPVITLTGPRQSGKTTLVKAAFPDHAYTNLEDPETREYALHDPKEYLRQSPGGLIIDEAQRVPDLFSYIQVLCDEDSQPGRFILTGSHNFLLMKSIRQSLAGRTAVLHLLPLSQAEIQGRRPMSLDQLGLLQPGAPSSNPPELMGSLFKGGYPRIFDHDLPPQEWLANYARTYVERDVQDVLRVSDLNVFRRFLGMCAARNGQLLNLTSLASDCGITHPTAKSWLAVLEAGFLVKLLQPHHRNFNKRLVKSPKIYFLDTGLLCYLLRIRTAEDLRLHPLRGNIFESHVLSELEKNFLNRGLEPDLYFWRDSTGLEIDFLVDHGERLTPIEAKSGTTLAREFFQGLTRWQSVAGQTDGPAALVYGGQESSRREGAVVYPWFVL
jgi:predicted AAA+ superfamily ATPase